MSVPKAHGRKRHLVGGEGLTQPAAQGVDDAGLEPGLLFGDVETFAAYRVSVRGAVRGVPGRV